MTSLSIIVPCYDEEEAIGILIERLDPVVGALAQGYEIEVMCVDDGSDDDTVSIIERSAVTRPWLRIVRHDHNQGLGEAIRTGVRTSRADYLAMLDADGTFPPEVLPRLFEKLEEGYDIVIGSAFHPDGTVEDVNPFRLFVSRSLSYVYQLLTRSDIHSFSGIFRVYRREIFEVIDFSQSGFSSVSEILLQAIERRMHIAEVPTTLSRRQLGESKIRFWLEVYGHLKLVVRCLRIRFGEAPEVYVRQSTTTQETLPSEPEKG